MPDGTELRTELMARLPELLGQLEHARVARSNFTLAAAKYGSARCWYEERQAHDAEARLADTLVELFTAVHSLPSHSNGSPNV